MRASLPVVAIVTCFDDQEAVGCVAVRKQVQRQVAAGLKVARP